ncbi:MAG: methyltransferase [Pseudomonadota bacterium]
MATLNRWAGWRNRLLSQHDLRRRLQRFPLTRPTARRRAADLFAVNAGFINSQVLAACLELDLLERLSDQAATAEQLAGELELDALRLTRLLEASAELGLLERRRRDHWGLGAQGAVLRSDPGMMAMSLHHRALYTDLSEPVALLRNPPPSTQLAKLWPYAGTNQPEDLPAKATERYTKLMADSQRMVAEQILDAYDFGRHRSVLDLGGGSGAFLTAVAKAHPEPALTLLDLPAVIPHSEAALNRQELSSRVTRVGGDFFRDPLPQGHDLMTLVRIVHDHDDEPIRGLLARIFEALPPGGTLLIAEPMLGRHDRGGQVGNYFRFYLMAMGSGRPRSKRELGRMLKTAGFRRVRNHGTDVPLICSVISARKPG